MFGVAKCWEVNEIRSAESLLWEAKLLAEEDFLNRFCLLFCYRIIRSKDYGDLAQVPGLPVVSSLPRLFYL